ncbi:MAG: hypothetical protein RMJ87_05895 [Cytophagales bacterium]|nr:hypothetical protein [Bernardetiaceae bacterium]MDW8204541.1 hypothetical protein [Cytophagales bacterium]
MEKSAAPCWIVSPGYDLTFFIGSCLLTWAFFGLYQIADQLGWVLQGDNILITYFVFTAFFDHPHIFQTFARTHLDRTEFNRRRFLYTWGLGLFIIAGFLITALGWESELIVFAAVFGTWHIIRQHYGFLRAYKKLNQDTEELDNWLDYGMFYSGTFACFFNDYTDIKSPIVIYRQLTARFFTLPYEITEITWGLFLGFLVLFVGRQIWKMIQGKPLNLPKLLLLTAALTTHYFVFFATATPFLVAEALETVFHDVQYQGWMMHYEKRRFPHMRHIVLKMLGLSLLYGLIVGLVEIYGLLRVEWAMWVFVPFTMIVLYHYYVDGLIWKFGKDAELRRLMFSKE